MRARVALLALALVCAGCAGGGDEDEPQAQPPPPREPASSVADPQPGRTLLRFVRAAGEGDAEAMWSLLSAATRASMGPTLEQFRAGTAVELEEGVGTVAETAQVTLSRRVGGWGVAAVAGERTVEGELEDFSYGAALAREGGRWRVELGALVIGSMRPEPHEETGPRPRVAATVSAPDPPATFLVWLDGRELALSSGDAGAFSASFSATAPVLEEGRHELVAFAATEDAAGAIAWPFTVAAR